MRSERVGVNDDWMSVPLVAPGNKPGLAAPRAKRGDQQNDGSGNTPRRHDWFPSLREQALRALGAAQAASEPAIRGAASIRGHGSVPGRDGSRSRRDVEGGT